MSEPIAELQPTSDRLDTPRLTVPDKRKDHPELEGDEIRIIDKAFIDIRSIEYSEEAMRAGHGIKVDQLQATLDTAVPKIRDIGDKAIPYLVDKIDQSPADGLPLRTQLIFSSPESNYLATERGRDYLAFFIDGHAGIDDAPDVLEALAKEKITGTSDGKAAHILLGTMERITYPLRLAQEEGKVPDGDTRLKDIQEGLIALYGGLRDHYPRGGIDSTIEHDLLRAIALTGSPESIAFVEEHMEDISAGREYLFKECQDLATLDNISWDSFLQYDFSPSLNKPLNLYRFPRRLASQVERENLMKEATGATNVQKEEVAIAEPENLSISDPAPIIASESVVTTPDVLAQKVPIVEEPKAHASPEPDKNTSGSRRRFLGAAAAAAALAGLVGVRKALSPGEPGHNDPAQASSQLEGQIGKGLPDSQAQEPESTRATSQITNEGSGPTRTEHIVESPSGLEEVMEKAEPIKIGEHGDTISESVWELNKKDIEWWMANYWYSPSNLGALGLVNYDAFKKSFDELSIEPQIKATFPDGYPSIDEILNWIDQAEQAEKSLGINPDQTPIAYQGREDQLDTIDPLVNLQNTMKWVEGGSQFLIPDMRDSDKVVKHFSDSS